MADTFTTNLALTKPEVGASTDTWGNKTNDNWDDVDAALGAGTPIKIMLLDGAVGAPALLFTGSPTTGLYQPAADQIGVTIAGVLRGLFSASGLAITGGVTISTTLGVTGASTLASLGVTGAATVGGTLGVTGAITGPGTGLTGTGAGLTAGSTNALSATCLGTSNTWTTTQNFNNSGTTAVTAGAASGFLVALGSVANPATVSFHRAGAYGVNMGLDTDNVFRLGGWSDGAQSRWTADTSGNFVARGNVTAFSDRRLKTDILPIWHPLDKVCSLNGITYTRTDEGSDSRRQTGVIAQEVQAVLPEAVMEADNGILTVAYGNMVGLLIEAIKELRAEVNQLKTQAL